MFKNNILQDDPWPDWCPLLLMYYLEDVEDKRSTTTSVAFGKPKVGGGAKDHPSRNWGGFQLPKGNG